MYRNQQSRLLNSRDSHTWKGHKDRKDGRWKEATNCAIVGLDANTDKRETSRHVILGKDFLYRDKRFGYCRSYIIMRASHGNQGEAGHCLGSISIFYFLLYSHTWGPWVPSPLWLYAQTTTITVTNSTLPVLMSHCSLWLELHCCLEDKAVKTLKVS